MKQKAESFSGTMLFTLIGAASLGALAVALTTPKTGKEFQNSLRVLADRFRSKKEDLDSIEDEVGIAAFI